jgi:maltose phosphorylase
MNVVYGFGGMRSDGPVLSFKPVLPARWKMFSFSTLYRGTVLSITIDRKQVFARVTEGTAVDVDIFGKRYKVGRSGAVAPMPAARIAGK